MFGCEGDEAQAIRPFGLSATNVMETTLAIGGLPRGVGSPGLLLGGGSMEQYSSTRQRCLRTTVFGVGPTPY